MPLTRVTSIAPGQVICAGVVNLRRFQARAAETLAIGELFERGVVLKETGATVYIEDIAIEQTRGRTWQVTKLYVRDGERRGMLGFSRKTQSSVVEIDAVVGLGGKTGTQGAALVIQSFADYKPADLASALLEMSPTRSAEIAAALDNERLADVLEELPEAQQIALLKSLNMDRAAEVLEEMEPDDAADLLGSLSESEAEELLELMEPEDANVVRQLLSYEDDTAGGLMTTEPVIVGPETSVATCLALVRREDLPPALASMVFVVRPPLETPTGRYIGVVHLQRLLREPPHDSVGNYVDPAVSPFDPEESLQEVARRMAAYNILALPVVDDGNHLLGAISIDDVLDHLLPEDWRGQEAESRAAMRASARASRG